MPKLIIFLCLFSFVFSRQVEILTGDFLQQGDLFIAKNGVVVSSDDFFVFGKNAVFDSKKNQIEIYGNVIFNHNKGGNVVADYLRFDVNSSAGFGQNVFFPNWQNKIWLKADDIHTKDKTYTLKNALSSSCNPNSPDWSISAKRASYDENASWIHLFHPVFYAGKTPVFYLPYFGYSTDNERKSGLLPPNFGSSKYEGDLLGISLYLAPQKSWDLELSAQTRSLRGSGYGLYFRFADSAYSKGDVHFGQFIDKDNFSKKYNIKNKTHQATRINYNRQKLFSKAPNHSDKLFIKWHNYNDVDYLKLEHLENSDVSTDQIITNEINYHYKTSDIYMGLKLRETQDLLNLDRKDLLQTMPNVRVHKFLNRLGNTNATYLLDLDAYNLLSKSGTNIKKLSFYNPFLYSFDLFNDFLNVSAQQNINLLLTNEDKQKTNYAFYTNTRLELSSTLIKKFDNFNHTINADLNYVFGNFSQASKDINTSEFDKQSLNFSLRQYINTDRNIFTQNLNQAYAKINDKWQFLDTTQDLKFSPLSMLDLSHNLVYSLQEEHVLKNYTFLTLKNNFLNLSLGYLQDYSADNKKTTDYYTINASKTIFSRHKLQAEYHHDKISHNSRKISAAYLYKKDCWDFAAEFTRLLEPLTKDGGSSSRMNDTVLIKLNINPIGGYNFKAYEK